MNQRSNRGFSLIELMVVIAIIAIMAAIAVPSFGAGVRNARERSIVQRMMQDFMWARGAAATVDASTLNSSLSGPPTLTFVLKSDCSWTTAVNGTTDTKHSMTSAAVSAISTGVACSGTGLTLPATFTFNPQGFVDKSGTLNFSSTSQLTPLKFQFLYSGSVFRAASSAS